MVDLVVREEMTRAPCSSVVTRECINLRSSNRDAILGCRRKLTRVQCSSGEIQDCHQVGQLKEVRTLCSLDELCKVVI